MPKINLSQFKNSIKGKNFPALFERYEIFVVAGGVVIVFLLAGWIFYSKGYQTVTHPITISVSLPRINQILFEKTLQEIESKKQPFPDEPVIDPFR